MTSILIPHGTSPTGFGIRQRRTGKLRPLSACCGRTMTAVNYMEQAKCKGCGTDYTEWSSKQGCSLGNDVDPQGAERVLLQQWVRRVTGYTDATVSVV